MSEAPERINVVVTEAEILGPFPPEDTRSTEYVRADHSAALVAAAYQAAGDATDALRKQGLSKGFKGYWRVGDGGYNQPFDAAHAAIRALTPDDATAKLEALIQKAVEAERERCAQVADRFHNDAMEWAAVYVKNFGGVTDSARIAAAIREGKA